MIGLGTLVNSAAIVAGGVAGHFFGRFLSERCQDTLSKTCGVSVLFIGIAGAVGEMFTMSSSGTMMLVLSLAIGALIGELINIEGLFERFGEWLKVKTGNARDKQSVNAFVTASLTVCIGAMAIVGAIRDGLAGDSSILITESILDLIIIVVMTCSMGKGVRVFGDPGAGAGGRDNAAGKADKSYHDRRGALEYLAGGFGADILRRDKSRMGKDGACRKSAAGSGAGGGRGVFTDIKSLNKS